MIDFGEIDIILISNYLCMMALPYVTEHTGFRGLVYATEPTLQIGRYFVNIIISFVQRDNARSLSCDAFDRSISVLISSLFIFTVFFIGI